MFILTTHPFFILEKAVKVKVDASVDSEGILTVLHAIVALLQKHAQLALTSVNGTVGDISTIVTKLVPQILTVCQEIFFFKSCHPKFSCFISLAPRDGTCACSGCSWYRHCGSQAHP
jgi:hypothetical protein